MPTDKSVSVPPESRPALQKFRTALNALYLEVEPSIAADIGILANCALIEAEAASSSLLPVPQTRFPQKWSEDAFVLLAGLRNSVIWELAPQIVKEITRLVEEALALSESVASLPVGESTPKTK